MNKANKLLVVPTDVLKALQKLAFEANENEDASELAEQRYIRAKSDALSSASQFVVALYNFALEFANSPKLIDDKLSELGIEVRETSSVYHHICRIAFAKVPESDSKRVRMSKRASLIERAHQLGMSSKDFKKLVANGLRNAERKLFEQTGTIDTKALKKARDIASKFMNSEEYELTGATLAEDVAEGSELQLLARYKDGKITVYGVVPPHLSNAEAVLNKLVASTTKAEKHKHDVMRDMLATIKLVAKTSDDKATASYKVKDNKFHFVISGKNGRAALTASSDFDVFQQDITMPVAKWAGLLSMLIPMRKHIDSIEASASEIVVSVNEREIPDINAWVTKENHVLTGGKASGSTLLYELLDTREHLEEPTGRWEALGSVAADKVAKFFEFKPSKKYATIEFNEGALKFGSLARLSDEHTHLTRPSYRQLKSACSKLKGLASELRFEKKKNQLRVAADVGSGITMTAYVGIE